LEINLKLTISFLLSAVFMLLLAACGDTQPLPDIVEPEPVLAEDAFEDIFKKATRVDKVSIDDIKNCRVESKYDVKLGDIISVEVALARREDGRSRGLGNFQPYMFTSGTHQVTGSSEMMLSLGGGVSTYHFEL
jgi:hypothetical protein